MSTTIKLCFSYDLCTWGKIVPAKSWARRNWIIWVPRENGMLRQAKVGKLVGWFWWGIKEDSSRENPQFLGLLCTLPEKKLPVNLYESRRIRGYLFDPSLSTRQLQAGIAQKWSLFKVPGSWQGASYIYCTPKGKLYMTSWWLQPSWKILVKLDHFPR